jgi:HEAT repeat protein
MKNINTFLFDGKGRDDTLYADAQRELQAMGRTAITYLIEIMHYESEHASWRAARLLSETNDPALVPTFIKALKSPSLLIRQTAASFLGKTGSEATVPSLIARLTVETGIVQATIIEALGKLQDKRALEPLLILLRETSSGYVQQCIIKVLGQFGEPRIAAALIPFVNSTDHHVRSRARETYEQLTGTTAGDNDNVR